MSFVQREVNAKDEWLTPKYIIDELGPFDLDPCAPIERPWSTAKEHLTIKDDGLWPTWDSWKFVWCNPPYGKHTKDWLQKLAEHNNGIALVFARTETQMFQEFVWNQATAILFMYGRITFVDTKGQKKHNAPAPSVLIAYGNKAAKKLRDAKIKGKFILL